jgi:hypothetical protein
MAQTKASLLKKIYDAPPSLLKRRKLHELLRVYQDLEKTLKSLKESAARSSDTSLSNINVRKLILQLSRSKKRLERKIGNTLLLEKQHLKKRLKTLTSNLGPRQTEA